MDQKADIGRESKRQISETLFVQNPLSRALNNETTLGGLHNDGKKISDSSAKAFPEILFRQTLKMLQAKPTLRLSKSLVASMSLRYITFSMKIFYFVQ